MDQWNHGHFKSNRYAKDKNGVMLISYKQLWGIMQICHYSLIKSVIWKQTLRLGPNK